MFHVKQYETAESVPSVADVIELADACGLALTENQARLMIAHVCLVLEANRTMNLTRITSAKDVLQRHLLDSVLFLNYVDVPVGKILDLGSGAGFPGIPLAILGYDIALCEATKKKADFLRTVAVQHGLSCEVYALRAEELAAVAGESYDSVTARAVAALGPLVELSAPLLVLGGRLFALKGTPSREEVDAGDNSAKLIGMSPDSSVMYKLPSGDARSVYVYGKIGVSSVALPRRTGLAQRQPLVR